jgi:hypothetical protein
VTTPFNFWLARDKPSIPLFHPAAQNIPPSQQQLHSTREHDDDNTLPIHHRDNELQLATCVTRINSAPRRLARKHRKAIGAA